MSRQFSRQLKARLTKAGLSASNVDAERLERYLGFLDKWNAKLNLTSLRIDGFPAATLDRLIVDPLLAAQLVADGPLRWIDLGSGGGSPAVPLRLVKPRANLTMVDSITKKTIFLTEVARTLALEQVKVLNARIEDLPALFGRHTAHLVTIRAVRMSMVSAAALELLDPTGVLLRFGGANDEVPDGFREVDRRALTSPGGVVTALTPL